jgi:tetratricopeptide (TPR) repeat protein
MDEREITPKLDGASIRAGKTPGSLSCVDAMKTNRCTSLLLAALAATAAWLSTPLLAQTNRNDRAAEAALQAAINREVIDGNLQAAIEHYTQVIERHAASRAVAAKALYHLGQAHEKLGNAEARKAYERIAREFADQKDVAADAGRRLASLDRTPSANGDAVTLRKIATIDSSWFRAVSPRGRFIAYMIANANIIIEEPATGKKWPLVKCTWPESPWNVAFSPDEGRLAYDLQGRVLWCGERGGVTGA